MRRIDADELKKKLEAEHCDCEVIQIIDDMPTAAENVKYGAWAVKSPSRMKWIPDESDDITAEETTVEDMIEQKCSVCQRWSIKFAHHIEMNFCPNCGAKMITRGHEE
jgi:predicted RNA-binding Zn-ribbon protein involved in translation (DUF1610 family)